MVRWGAGWDGPATETAAAVLRHNAEGNKQVRRERDTHLLHVEDVVGAREVPASAGSIVVFCRNDAAIAPHDCQAVNLRNFVHVV
jgi:hypothetical protein